MACPPYTKSKLSSIAALVIGVSSLIYLATAQAAPFSEAPECSGSGGRFALLIGNQDYHGSLSPLSNPRRNTAAFSKLLCANGFTVFRHSDLGVAKFDEALKRFAAAARGAKTTLVYYSGHGFAASGRNWLVPVDADVGCDVLADGAASETDTTILQRHLVDLSDNVLARLKGDGDQIIILDACRTNPVRSCKGGSSPTLQKGLTRVDGSAGRLIVYATQDGQPALDSVAGSETSPLMTAITKRLPDEANTDWLDAMSDIGREVHSLTDGRQTPNFDFSLKPPRMSRAKL